MTTRASTTPTLILLTLLAGSAIAQDTQTITPIEPGSSAEADRPLDLPRMGTNNTPIEPSSAE